MTQSHGTHCNSCGYDLISLAAVLWHHTAASRRRTAALGRHRGALTGFLWEDWRLCFLSVKKVNAQFLSKWRLKISQNFPYVKAEDQQKVWKLSVNMYCVLECKYPKINSGWLDPHRTAVRQGWDSHKTSWYLAKAVTVTQLLHQTKNFRHTWGALSANHGPACIAFHCSKLYISYHNPVNVIYIDGSNGRLYMQVHSANPQHNIIIHNPEYVHFRTVLILYFI